MEQIFIEIAFSFPKAGCLESRRTAIEQPTHSSQQLRETGDYVEYHKYRTVTG